MRSLLLSLMALGALVGCARQEGISRFVDPNTVYQMTLLDGQPFGATASITFPRPGQVSGQAPCNRFNAVQTVPYPWFGLENVIVTRMACPNLEQERAFFAALEGVTLAEVVGDTLILSNPAGREMVFRASGSRL